MTDFFDPNEEKVARVVLRPKDAATLILVKREGEPRVLMGQRHSSMAFMAGKFVFPGGRAEIGDQRIAAAAELRPEVMEKVSFGVTLSRARGFALAAIRETFEETGVLVGTSNGKCPRTRSAAWSRFFAHDVMPKLDTLDLIARAVTPPNRPRRFDARFFMADASAIARIVEEPANEELLKPCWLTLAEARALDLPSITRRILAEVEVRLGSGPRPIPFFRFSRGKPSLTYL
ncbi:MAG: NUDIX hydrolase [Alphaproteobacteria bacterium]|nr:NUDIX hydrolase [Alphaproteobacteria bacterium]MDE2112315.1 NUDIX hydrolase [Alphaproteobacteria bacterium]MDE2494287.1 NUDIX hydrolase [Alphaproteobacteria bacterium]